MLNQRSNSEGNIFQLFNENEKNEKKLSSFLPQFLVRKVSNQEINAENCKQEVFLEDENEEEGLEIKMDSYLINEKLNINNTHNHNPIVPRPKKSHSEKLVTQFNDFHDENIDFAQFQNYNPRINYQQKQNYNNYHNHVPNNYPFNNDHHINNYHNQNHNQFLNYNYNNNNTHPNKNFYSPYHPQNNINYNNYNNYNNFSPNHFVANNYQNYNNPNNFNNKYFPKPESPHSFNNFVEMNNITNNMNHLNIHNYTPNHKNNQARVHNNSSSNQEHYINIDLQNNDSLNNSVNNSLDEGNSFFGIKAPPKKTFSDSNLKLIRNKPEMKSLFKEKIEPTTEEINLSEILNNQQFDLPEFIKTQKGSRVMQKELNSISPENLELLLRRLCPSLTGIMIDTYGNYFSQKLIQCCSPQQRLLILKSVILK